MMHAPTHRRPLHPRWLWAVVFVVLASAGASSAWAKPKLAILGIEPVGTLDAQQSDVAKDLTTALRSRAQTGKFTLSTNKRELVDEKLMANCLTEALSCMAQISNNLGAEYLLYGHLEKVTQKGVEGYWVSLWLLKVSKAPTVSGSLVGDPFTEFRSAKEMAQPGLGKWVDVVYGKLTGEEVEKPIGKLTVHTTNTGRGTVFINGDNKGRLDDGRLTITLAPDQTYTLAIESDGFKRHEQPIRVTAGQTETVDILLLKAEEDVVVPPITGKGGSRSKFVWIGAGTLAVSAALWGAVAYHYFGPIREYDRLINDTDPENTPWLKEADATKRNALDSGDCDDYDTLVAEDRVDPGKNGTGKFEDACEAKKWQLREGIAAGVLVVAGAGMLAYGLLTKDDETPPMRGARRGGQRRPPIAITPFATPHATGAILRVDW